MVGRREQIEQLPVRLRQGTFGFGRVSFATLLAREGKGERDKNGGGRGRRAEDDEPTYDILLPALLLLLPQRYETDAREGTWHTRGAASMCGCSVFATCDNREAGEGPWRNE